MSEFSDRIFYEINNCDVQHSAFLDALHNVESISIIEFGGLENHLSEGTNALVEYLEIVKIDISIINQVVLVGKFEEKTKAKKRIFTLLPQCKCITKSVKLHDLIMDPVSMDSSLLIIFDYCNREKLPSSVIAIRQRTINRIVSSFNSIYCASFFVDEQSIRFEFCDSLDRFTLVGTREIPEQTEFCKKRQESLGQYTLALNPYDALKMIVQDIRNGCKTCNMCYNYNKSHSCPIAQNKLAEWFRDGVLGPQSNKLAHAWSLKSAHQKYLPAMHQVAKDCIEGTGCEKDVDKAINLSLLSYCLFHNENSCRDIIDAFKAKYGDDTYRSVPWMARLANSGDKEMMEKLAQAYLNGSYNMPIDDSLYEKWHAKFMDSIATFDDLKDYLDNISEVDKIVELGDKYYKLANRDQRKKWAYQCYIKAAELGDAGSMEKVGEEYWNGVYLDKNLAKSLYWSKKALENGCKGARFRVAYLSGEEFEGHTPDYETSYHLYNELSEEGNTSAMNNLGCMYGNGHYVETDFQKQFSWYLRASEKGDAWAMKNLAYNYKNGRGVDQNPEKAFMWFEKSAKLGEPTGMLGLARCYKEGDGTQRNIEAMIEWYDKAIAKGYEDAILELGEYYDREGNDKSKAVSLYTLAAEKYGNSRGQYLLAESYRTGEGVEMDDEKAIYWYRQSAKQGYRPAQLVLEQTYNTNWIDVDAQPVVF